MKNPNKLCKCSRCKDKFPNNQLRKSGGGRYCPSCIRVVCPTLLSEDKRKTAASRGDALIAKLAAGEHPIDVLGELIENSSK